LRWRNGADFAPEYLRQLASEQIAEQLDARETLVPPVLKSESTPRSP
jgi:hypothetical protein